MKKLISRCNFLKMGALASAVMMLAAAVPEAEKIRVPM